MVRLGERTFMAREPKPKKVAVVELTRVDGEYAIKVEDEAGKTGRYLLTSEQALQLADKLDDLLADEEDEQGYPSAA